MKSWRVHFLFWLFVTAFTAPLLAQEHPAQIVSGKLQVITTDNIAQITELLTAESSTKHISVSPDGLMMAVVTQNADYDYAIVVTSIRTGKHRSSMQGRMDFFRELIWSPDSKRLVVISGRTTGSGVEERSVKTYTIEKGAETGYYIMGNSDSWYVDYAAPSTSSAIPPVQVAWNPASNMLAVAFYDSLAILDGDTENPLFTQPSHRTVEQMSEELNKRGPSDKLKVLANNLSERAPNVQLPSVWYLEAAA